MDSTQNARSFETNPTLPNNSICRVKIWKGKKNREPGSVTMTLDCSRLSRREVKKELCVEVPSNFPRMSRA